MFARRCQIVAMLFTTAVLAGCDSPQPNSQTSDVVVESVASPTPSIPFEVIAHNDDGSQTVEYQMTRYTAETRSREVATERVRSETRVKTVAGADGKPHEETYTVDVPYTETTVEEYTVQVPVIETRNVVVPSGQDVAAFLAAETQPQDGGSH